MTNPQIILSPSGERLVVLPETEYQRLKEAAEDRADIAEHEAFRTRLAAGEEEIVPAEVANALVAGENAIRVWRRHRALTLAELAEASGLSQPYLSQLESGARDGTVKAMRRIAGALGLALDDLLD